MKTTVLAACIAAGLAAPALADTTTTFDSGTEGWSISGRDHIAQFGGHPGPNMHGVLIDIFGADVRNSTNGAFLGDLSRYGAFELSIDIKVNSIVFDGREVTREFVVELRDFDNDHGLPWTSVYYHLGTLKASSDGPNEWKTYSVVIDDPFAVALPVGWGGYGDETPLGDPILPAERTFASVLASVDEISFTTFLPGWGFLSTNFDMQVDNISIRSVPAPSAAALLALGGLAAARRRR